MDTATTTCTQDASTTQCVTQTEQYVTSGFTYGEILTVLLLLIISIQISFLLIKKFIYD